MPRLCDGCGDVIGDGMTPCSCQFPASHGEYMRAVAAREEQEAAARAENERKARASREQLNLLDVA